MLVLLTLWFATFDPCLCILASSAAVFKNLPTHFCQGALLCTTLKDLLSGRHVVQQGRMECLACSFLQVGGFSTACKNGQDTCVCLWCMLLVRKDAYGDFPCLYVFWWPTHSAKQAFCGHLELDPSARKRLPSTIYGSRQGL